MFEKLRLELKNDIKYAFDIYISHVETQLEIGGYSSFWIYIKRLRDAKTCDKKCYILRESEYTEPKDIVNAFKEYFKSVYIQSSVRLEDFIIEDPLSNGNIELFEIAINDIKTSIRQLISNKSEGPDNIPAYLVKRLQ